MHRARHQRQHRAMQCNSERVAAGAIARNSHQGRVPQGGHLCRRIPLIPLNPTESRLRLNSVRGGRRNRTATLVRNAGETRRLQFVRRTTILPADRNGRPAPVAPVAGGKTRAPERNFISSNRERSAAPALQAEAPDPQEPHHEHEPRLRPRRGRHAERALSALSRDEGEGRDCAHHVRRLVQRLARVRVATAADQPLRRARRRALPAVLAAHPRPRHCPDVPGKPCRRAGRALRGRGARAHRSVARARDIASGFREGNGRARHRAGRGRLRRGGGAVQGGRARRHRDLRRRAPHRPVPLAGDQSPQRQVRRLGRESLPFRADGARGDPQARGRGLHRRHALPHR